MRFPCSVAVALAVLGCGCGFNRGAAQRDAVHGLLPAELRPPAPVPAASIRTYRVRAYADPGYQAHAPDWRERLLAQIDRANAILGPDLGVRLAVESIRTWDRQEEQGGLAAALDQLVLADAGTDVDWVIGYVARRRSGGQVDAAGLAQLFARHLVLAAPEDAEDAEAVGAALDALGPEERSAAMAAQRLHIEGVAFLHEWGHSIGAVHECSPGSVMTPRATVVTSGYSAISLGLARLGLERRDAAGAAARGAWRERYRAAVQELAAAAFDRAVLEQGLAEARRLAEDDPAEGPDGLLRGHARAVVDDALRRFRLGARLSSAQLPTGQASLRVELDPRRPTRVVRAAGTGSAAADGSSTESSPPCSPPPAPAGALAASPAGARITVVVEPGLLRPHRLLDAY